MSKNLLEFIDRVLSDQLDPKEDPQDVERRGSLLEYLDKEIADLSLVFEKVEKLDIQAAWESIPLPELSELGWADPSKKKGKLSNKARFEMSQYLGEIKAVTLEDQIVQLQEKLDTAGKQDMSLSEILSFLIFYKTLTYIIGDFNPATAGFLFESLLGVLTGGKQIAAAGAGGGDTIADFVYPRGVKSKGGAQYVSLKLLTEKGTGIGGSFNDLVDDMLAKNAMQYVVVLKTLGGSKESLTGELGFYEFTFNRKDFVKLLKHSTAGRKCLVLAGEAAREMLDEPAGEFAHKERWNDWIKTFLPALLGGGGDVEGFTFPVKKYARVKKGWEEVRDMEVKKYAENNFCVEKDEKGRQRPAVCDKRESWAQIHDPEMYFHHGSEDEQLYKEPDDRLYYTYMWLRKMWDSYNEGAVSEKELEKRRVGDLGNVPLLKSKKEYSPKKEVNWMGVDESLSVLEKMAQDESISDKDYWLFIKQYSYGTLTTEHFEVTQEHMKKITTEFARLRVGREVVAGALNKMITDTNKMMFDIFSNLNELKTYLRGFFMNDMETDDGIKAKESAEKVYKSTSALISTEEGSE